MNRLDAMLDRLPPVWRIDPGSRLQQLLSLAAVVMTEFDQDLDRVQRSHWVDHAFDRRDVEKLGALFDVDAAVWEDLPLYRTRLKATIAALLRGAVTPREILGAVERVLAQGLDSFGIVRAEGEERGTSATRARLVEFPLVRRRSSELLARHGRLRPLDRFMCDHGGVANSPLAGTVRGVRGARSSAPVLVNLTNGDALGFAGLLRCGDDLVLEANEDTVRARVRGVDVTERLVTVRGFTPGSPFGKNVADAVPRPLRLQPGLNELWFVCLGMYDAPGYDGAGFQAPTLELVQGVFAGGDPQVGSRFDSSLFHQDPALIADLHWDEAQPARFRVDLPLSAVARESVASTPEVELEHLIDLLDATVSRLRAASVDGRVRRTRFTERATMRDRAIVPEPEYRETQETEAALAALSALFDVSAKEGARYE